MQGLRGPFLQQHWRVCEKSYVPHIAMGFRATLS